jgi:Bacterial SH3 domain
MNRVLIVLCMAGWALYIVHTNAHSGGDLLAHTPKVSQELSPTIQAPAASIQSELQPIAATSVQSPHAIIPDEIPRQVPPNAPASAPQMQTGATSLPEARQDLTAQQASSQEPEEQLKVTAETSIRNGPSGSAKVIGRAHAGAKLFVKSRQAGWVQFFDSAANKSGWISLAYLAPTDGTVDVQSTVPKRPKQAERPKQAPKAAKLKSPMPLPKVRQLPPTFAELPADQEFVPPRRGGLFGLFWRRRLSDLPPP